MPLTVLEAMGGGTAVVASAVYGVPEIVSHGESGWLVPAGDIAQLAHALRLLGEDDALRERLAHAGQARYESEFTAARMAERTSAVYLDRDQSHESIVEATSRLAGAGASEGGPHSPTRHAFGSIGNPISPLELAEASNRALSTSAGNPRASQLGGALP
jgi:hypothetical protein